MKIDITLPSEILDLLADGRYRLEAIAFDDRGKPSGGIL
jgi:hypothetical protein